MLNYSGNVESILQQISQMLASIVVKMNDGSNNNINMEQLEKIILKSSPQQWEPDVEQDFGDGTYGKRVQGNISTGANSDFNVSLQFDAGAASSISIISIGGQWVYSQLGFNPLSLVVGAYNSNYGYSSIMSDGLYWYFNSNSTSSRTNAPYDIWIIYTKGL